MTQCQCALCLTHAEFEKQLEGLPADKAAYFRKFRDAVDNVQADRDYYRVLVDGSWPDADAVIAGFRAQRRREEEPTLKESPPAAVPDGTI